MSDTLVLETNELTKTYNGSTVVNAVNMHIHKGDIYGFVGENGAGKTTIIRLITGLARPTSGSFSIFGVANKDPKINDAKRRIGGIVEAVSLNKGLNAIENLKLQCLITGVSKTEDELKEVLERVGLGEWANSKKKAGAFSLGMRQRLGIASVLLSNPEFIVLDEPMNGLDPQGFIDVRDIILKLHNEGITFLISSHILSELDKICTRVGFISHGVLLEELSIEELRSKSRKKTLVSSKNNDDLLVFLKNKLHYSSMEKEDGIAIYDEVDINQLMKTLVDNKYEIERLSVIEETIEDYYAQLMFKGAKK